jgi:hypothetical protein
MLSSSIMHERMDCEPAGVRCRLLMFDVELNTSRSRSCWPGIFPPEASLTQRGQNAGGYEARVKSCWFTSEVRRDAKCEARVGTLDEAIDLKSNVSPRGSCLG